MKDYISERAVELAQFIVDNKATVRAAAKAFNVSKSTVHTVATKKNISKSLCTLCKGSDCRQKVYWSKQTPIHLCQFLYYRGYNQI